MDWKWPEGFTARTLREWRSHEEECPFGCDADREGCAMQVWIFARPSMRWWWRLNALAAVLFYGRIKRSRKDQAAWNYYPPDWAPDGTALDRFLFHYEWLHRSADAPDLF